MENKNKTYTHSTTAYANKKLKVYCPLEKEVTLLKNNPHWDVYPLNAEKVTLKEYCNFRILYLSSVKKIIMEGCCNVETLDAQNAEQIILKEYCNVETLDAQNAKYIFINKSKIGTLNAQNAKYIFINDSKIRTLNAQNAENVIIENTSFVEEINVKDAKNVFMVDSVIYIGEISQEQSKNEELQKKLLNLEHADSVMDVLKEIESGLKLNTLKSNELQVNIENIKNESQFPYNIDNHNIQNNDKEKKKKLSFEVQKVYNQDYPNNIKKNIKKEIRDDSMINTKSKLSHSM